MKSQEKRDRLRGFLNPSERGKWLEDVFSSERVGCPDYAIIPGTGRLTYDPEEIKDIYFREGTSVLKLKRQRPPPYDKKLSQDPPHPPDCKKPRNKDL